MGSGPQVSNSHTEVQKGFVGGAVASFHLTLQTSRPTNHGADTSILSRRPGRRCVSVLLSDIYAPEIQDLMFSVPLTLCEL